MIARIPFQNPTPVRRVHTRHRLALLLMLTLILALPMLPVAAQEATETDDPLDAPTLTVNVELILDASGSMSEPVSGTENQTRMEAAKVAMREVIERIPERDGLNVGFRIYGHKGSNAEEDRPRSCRATELLVPLEGVDRDALLAQVETFEPTGWTPLALALEAAAADFSPGGESVTNAVIMVTDGEETCGGDPCETAGALHASNIGVTTHVVGFGLSAEQQDAVRCIAEAGGGQLFAAEDAATLSDAVFAALTEVESETVEVPVENVGEIEVGGYVGGNAFGLLEAGAPGELSVVAHGTNEQGLPIVIRNNTGEDVENIQVEIMARADGELVAVGSALGVLPIVVVDGGVAIAHGYFGGTELPEGAEFEFAVSADPAGSDEVTSARDLIVQEANGGEDGIVGIFANGHEERIVGMIINSGICFDDAGAPVAYIESTTSNDELDPGKTRPFGVSYGLPETGCSTFLVTGYGSAE